ncbi:phosphatidylinositol/phosphatidylcholine transfer protein SFH11 isoform X2 [Cryptomeria japonica]|uniref:phosphatidylinositol/phosphatidylcholine transfer protein SFH11 isoform X2 n=1 Tax=Cryptomeria japonica TaxID=3369 RepID=UPI0027DA0FA8|nr:phosphatidylinositol/phosphatidylcholine transfer protein SFH11 isoform X2 [Cryptomeria japonica]
MESEPSDAKNELKALIDNVDEPLKKTFENMHHGYPQETLERFLKAREGNVHKTLKMLLDCLTWRVENEIDNILAKPIEPIEVYIAVRESQLIGMTGYSKKGLPVFALGLGLSTFDKASVDKYVQSHIQINEYRDCVVLPEATKKHGSYIGTCLKVLDMTGLKLSALSRIKVVKPLLQERTRRKIQVLEGSGREELLKVMDYEALPSFSKCDSSGSSKYSNGEIIDCFSLRHPFHSELYNYIKQQATNRKPTKPIKIGSFHVQVPEDPEGTIIAQTLESELHKLEGEEKVVNAVHSLKINDGMQSRLENGDTK